jgi:hypothetical protein
LFASWRSQHIETRCRLASANADGLAAANYEFRGDTAK